MIDTTPTATLPEVTLSEHDGVRYLHLDTPWIQGAMRLARPQQIELDYVQRMLASLLWIPTEGLGAGVAVQLGLGAAAITRFTLQQLHMHTTAVEINPQVVHACRAWFRLPEGGGQDDEDGGARLQVVCADAGEWARASPLAGAAQLLHVDLYDHDAAAPVLDDEAFYESCRALLAPGGVMAVNLFGRNASFEASQQRIVRAFGPSQVWSLRPTREGNTVVVAGRAVTVPPREELTQRAANIESRFGRLGLPARKWLRMVRPYQGPRGSE